MLAHQLAQAQVTLGTGTVLPTAVVGAVVAGRDAPGRNRNCRRIVSHRKQNGITIPLWDTIRPLKKVGNEKKYFFQLSTTPLSISLCEWVRENCHSTSRSPI